jgi:hypothetical protein
MSAGTVSYLYAVARPLPADEAADLVGVHDTPVHLVGQGDLVAVVSPVPTEEFDETPLRENLEDLSWLEKVARAHNHVVDFMGARTTTVPFRLATIYRNEQRVQEMLREQETTLSSALDRVTGRVEWGIKVTTIPAPRAEVSPTTAPSGRSFLQQRLSQRRAADDARQQATVDAEEIDFALAELAVARRRHRPQSREISHASGENVLNASYLVAADRTEDFRNRAAHLDATTPGCRVELTGPWAPYSFALEETSADMREESRSHE